MELQEKKIKKMQMKKQNTKEEFIEVSIVQILKRQKKLYMRYQQKKWINQQEKENKNY